MMKDRFKTKIWNKKKQRFEETLVIGIIKDPMIRDYIATDTEDGQINYFGDKCDDLEIINCTGLKDKNGKLIYEGDICKNTDNDCILTYGKIGQIKFIQNQNQSCYDWQQSGNRHGIVLGMELAENLEIIGNIHQNKDLLNA